MTAKLLPALLLFAVLGTNQQASAASVGAAKPPKPQTQQKTPSDARIEQAIRIKLAKSKLNTDHFTVSVTNGVATVDGSTNVMQHKGAMTRIAKAAGASNVRNNIRVSDAAKAKAAATLAKHRSTAAPPRAATHIAASAPPAAPPPIPRATVLPAGSSR